MALMIEGVVQANSSNGKYYGIRLNNKWSNGYGSSPVEKDDEVRIFYDVNEKNDKVFNNIESVVLLNELPPQEQNIGKAKTVNTDEFDGFADMDESAKTPIISFEAILDEQVHRMELIATKLAKINLSKESYPDKARMVNNLLIISNREFDNARRVKK